MIANQALPEEKKKTPSPPPAPNDEEWQNFCN
jgi:hypothetical protein